MYTWEGYWSDVCMCAKALLFVGSTRRTRVALMGINSPGWAIPYFASIFIDGIAVGVYATNTVEATHHVVSHAGCRVAFVDTLANAEKMLSVRRMQQEALAKRAQQQQQQGQPARRGESGRSVRRKRSSGNFGDTADAVCTTSGTRGRGRVSSDSTSRHCGKLQRGGSSGDQCLLGNSGTGAAEAAGHLVEEAGLDTAGEENGRLALTGSGFSSTREAAAAVAHQSLPFAPATYPPFQGVQTKVGTPYVSGAGVEGKAESAADEEDEGACDVLQLIVVYAEAVPEDMREQRVMQFDDFLVLGEQVEDVLLTERMEGQRAGQCCSIVYTSGTTGFPKGVMLSHDNLTWTAICSTQMMKIDNSHCLVSFLPLSHVAAQLVCYHAAVQTSCDVVVTLTRNRCCGLSTVSKFPGDGDVEQHTQQPEAETVAC
ncbi:UNVERIFIED_CONTAM: hypothetical protein H355_014949 [Colinus virginianus]|nr:hypothetical protein H355_014949 [Colinus virginianus]